MAPGEQMPIDLQRMITAEMASGEKVAWSAQPIPAALGRKLWPVVLFGIPFTAFAVFWIGVATWGTSKAKNGLPVFRLFPLFGLPFVLVGLGMLTSPIWIRRKAGRTAYVLTNRRAIIFSAGRAGQINVRSFEPERLGDLLRTQRADGSGDIIFTRDIGYNSADGFNSRRGATDVGFIGVRDVKNVEEKIRALAAQKRAEPT